MTDKHPNGTASSSATYTVVVPLVIADTGNGSRVHLYEGAPLKVDQLADGELQRLLDGAFVAKSGSDPTAEHAADDGRTSDQASTAAKSASATK